MKCVRELCRISCPDTVVKHFEFTFYIQSMDLTILRILFCPFKYLLVAVYRKLSEGSDIFGEEKINQTHFSLIDLKCFTVAAHPVYPGAYFPIKVSKSIVCLVCKCGDCKCIRLKALKAAFAFVSNCRGGL